MNLFRLLPFLGCLFLSACIEMEQGLRLEKDGSGRFELEASIPDLSGIGGPAQAEEGSEEKKEASSADKGFFSDKAATLEHAREHGIEILEDSVEKRDGREYSRLSVRFKDVDSLQQFMASAADGENPFEIELKNNTLKHRFSMNLKGGSPGSDETDSEGAAMAQALFADAYYRIHWELPGQVIEASEGAEINDNEVRFEIPLTGALSGEPMEIFARYKSTWPTWAYVAIGLGALLVILVIIKAMNKSR